ncbi:hypothetical protein [Streptomyces sp. NPDC059076]|uniref:hypothetical protein n=1 Tax=unclassified Streptomyces TaxID=2593676 RepID=UPI0036AD5191
MTVTDELRAQWHKERARREIVIGAIRGHLEEQPSRNAARACARQYCADITALAETVNPATNSTETPE